MIKPTPGDFWAFELNWEPALQAVLLAAGQPVVFPFIQRSDLESAPDDACFAVYESGPTDSSVRAWRTPPNGGPDSRISEAAGFTGTLVVTRRVPVSDAPTKPGEGPGCYRALCRQLGIIRFALLETENPFRTLLPWYDVLSIEEAQPNRQADGERGINQATLRFPIRWMPREGVW